MVRIDGTRTPGFKLMLAIGIGFLLSIPLFSIYLLNYGRQSESSEAMQSITLKVGQNSITIDQMGITLSGMQIKLDAQLTTEIASQLTTKVSSQLQTQLASQLQTQVQGTMVQVSGNAMTQISGAITMIG